jgi:signal transduction histidine kinase
MWAIRGGKLLRYSGSGERQETIAPDWLQGTTQINALLEDQTGALWIGTRDLGLLRFKDGEFKRVRTSFTDISTIIEDREENLWVGTWGGGLNRLSPCHFFLWETTQGTENGAIRSICDDSEGRMWVLNLDGVPARAADAGAHSFMPVPGWSGQVWGTVLCADRKAGVYMGTPNGLMQWKDGAASGTSFHEAIATLFMDRKGTLWIATDSGKIFSYRDGRSEAEGVINGALAMAEDSSGCLWVGTHYGEIYRRISGRFMQVAKLDAASDKTVRFIVPDGNDTVWIGAQSGGLYRWKNGRITQVPETAGLSLVEVRSMLIERAGPSGNRGDSSPRDVLWIGTSAGLLRVPREDLEGYMEGRRATLNIVPCGSNEGLPNAEFTEGNLNSAIQTGDGHLWFATNRGALEIPPGVAPDGPTLAHVMIEEASAGSVTYRPDTSNSVVFPPLPGAIRIQYTLPELRMPEQVRFRYRLGGSMGNGQWIDAGNQRETTIIQAEPGNYRFEVTAAVGDGPWLPSSAVMDFMVRPAWWQTAAFRGLVTLAAIGIIAAGVKEIVSRRMRARIRRLEQESAIERERGRIARDMHDELGANLTHIAATTRLAALEPADAAAGHLREIASVARQTVDSLDEIVWAVNPRNDTLSGTVEYIGKFAARFLAAAGIGVEIDIPNRPLAMEISAEFRYHLFLAVKEALNNVVKHSGAANAQLTIRITPDSLEVVVTDDGHGFSSNGADDFSNGIMNMRTRMSEIVGECRIESRPGAGSSVTFDLPFSAKTGRSSPA